MGLWGDEEPPIDDSVAELVPSDWVRHEAADVLALYAPPNYVSVDTATSGLVNEVFLQIVQLTLIEGQEGGINRGIVIWNDTLPPQVSLRSVGQSILGDSQAEGVDVEMTEVKVGEREALRLVVDASVGGFPTRMLMYLLRDLGALWVVQFMAVGADFDAALPIFEQSAETIRVLD